MIARGRYAVQRDSYAGARGRPGFGLTCVWPREPIRSQRKAWLKPGLPGVRDPLSAAGEAADRTGDAALGVNDGPAAVRAADGTGEGEPELGAV